MNTGPYKRAELKRLVKDAVPSVQFIEADGLGTPVPRAYIECRLPPADVPKLDAFCQALGRKAVWPACSQLYGAIRVILVNPEVEAT